MKLISTLSVIVAASASADQFKTTNLRGLQAEPIRQLNQNEYVVNIIHEGNSVALALVEGTDCGNLYSVTPVVFERIRGYVPGKGFEPFVSSSRFEWKINRDQSTIESVHCPGKVLDIYGADCNRGEVILYGLKSEDNRDNQMWDLGQVNSSLGPTIGVSNTDPVVDDKVDDDQFLGFSGTYGIESHHCSGEYIQSDMSPVQIGLESQSEFKSSAFKIEKLN
eukprot:scaffold44514_cov78-Cyclotella_meneghiniana.AAC.1